MGAGCLFFDGQGRVLLVKPTYKSGWEIPGGVVELNESPKQCCHREVYEELGLDRHIGDLLVVDYNQETNEKTESLMFIFDGGTLSPEDIQSILLQNEELSEFRFFNNETLLQEMAVALRLRVLAAIKQAAEKHAIYLENQHAG